MIIELTEYEIKEAIVFWLLKEQKIPVNIKYLPTDVKISLDKVTGYYAKIESHKKNINEDH